MGIPAERQLWRHWRSQLTSHELFAATYFHHETLLLPIPKPATRGKVETERGGLPPICDPRHLPNNLLENQKQMDSKEQQVKPPRGIEPEWIWKQKRCFELVRAIARYDAAGRCMDEAWFLELGKLIPETFPERERKHSSAND